MAASEQPEQDFKLVLASKKFLYSQKNVVAAPKDKLKAEILDIIFKHDMAPYYEHVCGELGWAADGGQLARMKSANSARVDELDAKAKDAEENLGESEVRDALQAKADYLCSVGDKGACVSAYKAAEGKTAGAGGKVDLVFSQMRLALLYGDWAAVKELLARAKALCEEGGDWERKNKLKVYTGIFSMYARDFATAAGLFLDSTATFTSTELFSYTTLVFYAVVTSLISLDRVTLRKRVIDAPEVLTVIDQVPSLGPFLNSLYACKYKEFLHAFVDVVDLMRADPYLSPHVRYYMRELRAAAYGQFLESYKSVTLDSMAAAFDVSVSFLDDELSEFIVAGRLNAKIDKVAGIVETNRPDAKNALYQDAIKKGDLLLNRIQKLSRIVDLE